MSQIWKLMSQHLKIVQCEELPAFQLFQFFIAIVFKFALGYAIKNV